MNIENRVFVVTGAGSGLGAAVARMLNSRGAKVALVDIREEPLRTLASELGKSCFVAVADVTSESEASAAIEAAVRELGGLDGLINCAGIAPGEKIVGRAAPHSLESFSRAVNVNLVGTFNMMRLVAARLVTREPGGDGERGVIINTASIAAFDGQVGQAAYAASKAGVVGLTLPAARELARYGVRVVAIAPGIFETPMMAGMPPEVQDSLGKSVPFPSRLGRPSEFAELVASIMENVMLNGEVIRLDGALRMGPR